jgi:lysine-specific demethylase 8
MSGVVKRLRDLVDLEVDPNDLQQEFELTFKAASNDRCRALLVALCLREDLSFALLDSVTDAVWERLNTGHWKNVDGEWRRLYGLVAVAKVRKIVDLANSAEVTLGASEIIRDLIRMSDLGLLMGAPVMNDACGRMASKLSALHRELVKSDGSIDDEEGAIPPKKKKVSVPDSAHLPVIPVPSTKELSLEDFIESHLSSETPIVVSGMMSDWPCMTDRRWSVDYVRMMAGERTVPVEIGSRYTDDGWTQKLMTIGEFIDNYMVGSTGNEKGYLAQHNLLDQVRELRDDIEIPDYCHAGDGDDVAINGWFGPEGTVSPLHTDRKHNFLCQVFGSKYVRLYPESESENLYPYDDLLLFNTSRIDLENVDRNAFPKFAGAKGFECVLDEGQMLYIPPKCWHFVKSLSPSFSLSFWFE